jgi:hypothetical protein
VTEPWIPVAWRDIYLWARVEKRLQTLSRFLLQQRDFSNGWAGSFRWLGRTSRSSASHRQTTGRHASLRRTFGSSGPAFDTRSRRARPAQEIKVHQLKLKAHVSAQCNAERDQPICSNPCRRRSAQPRRLEWAGLPSGGSVLLGVRIGCFANLEVVVYVRRAPSQAGISARRTRACAIPSSQFSPHRLDESLS